MKAGIRCEFRMKGRRQQVALLRGNDPAVGEAGKRPRISGYRLDDRRANEDRVVGIVRTTGTLQLRDIEVGLERLKLPPERVARHFDIHQAQERLLSAGIL